MAARVRLKHPRPVLGKISLTAPWHWVLPNAVRGSKNRRRLELELRVRGSGFSGGGVAVLGSHHREIKAREHLSDREYRCRRRTVLPEKLYG